MKTKQWKRVLARLKERALQDYVNRVVRVPAEMSTLVFYWADKNHDWLENEWLSVKLVNDFGCVRQITVRSASLDKQAKRLKAEFPTLTLDA